VKIRSVAKSDRVVGGFGPWYLETRLLALANTAALDGFLIPALKKWPPKSF
jgi:hypothetical protein